MPAAKPAAAQGWSKEDGGWGKKEKQVTVRDAEVAILATERILERTEEVAPSILLGKTIRIGKAILTNKVQDDLVHETATLGNYMAMVAREVEELKKKVKVQFDPAAKDPKYKAGLDMAEQVHASLINQSHDIDVGVQRIAPKLTKLNQHLNEHCTTKRMEDLLMNIFLKQSWSGLSVAYEYLVYVKCCHLMLVTVVNVKTENLASVAREFENFNNWILQLQLFLREHEEKYYLKCGIRVRI